MCRPFLAEKELLNLLQPQKERCVAAIFLFVRTAGNRHDIKFWKKSDALLLVKQMVHLCMYKYCCPKISF